MADAHSDLSNSSSCIADKKITTNNEDVKTIFERNEIEENLAAHPVARMETGELPLHSNETASLGGILRSMTSALFSIPFGFFQSNAQLRTWGEENVTDPSVQPIPQFHNSQMENNFHNSLPGYPNSCHENFLNRIKSKEEYDSIVSRKNFTKRQGVISLETPSIDMHFKPNKNFKSQPVGYNWNELLSYKLDTYPYVNAFMRPQNPLPMYNPGNPFVAYPYGVPAVEENEKYDLTGAKKSLWKCC